MDDYREYESPYDKLRHAPPDKETWRAYLTISSQTHRGKTVTIYHDDFPHLVFYSQITSHNVAQFHYLPEGNYTVILEGVEGEKHITLNNGRSVWMEWH